MNRLAEFLLWMVIGTVGGGIFAAIFYGIAHVLNKRDDKQERREQEEQ